MSLGKKRTPASWSYSPPTFLPWKWEKGNKNLPVCNSGSWFPNNKNSESLSLFFPQFLKVTKPCLQLNLLSNFSQPTTGTGVVHYWCLLPGSRLCCVFLTRYLVWHKTLGYLLEHSRIRLAVPTGLSLWEPGGPNYAHVYNFLPAKGGNRALGDPPEATRRARKVMDVPASRSAGMP